MKITVKYTLVDGDNGGCNIYIPFIPRVGSFLTLPYTSDKYSTFVVKSVEHGMNWQGDYSSTTIIVNQIKLTA